MKFIKKLIPESILRFIRPYYHGLISLLANFYFKRPSEKLIVIGVTGTNGKTTTVNLIASILNNSGFKCGYVSTATLNLGEYEYLNPSKITMPSGWFLHKSLAKMLEAGCKYAVVEVSSEGLYQNRHLGINFDVAVFTNLTPEHIEAHGGFENYKMAKGKLFKCLGKFKILNFKFKINSNLKKTIIVNADDAHSQYFKSFKADQYLSYGVKAPADLQAANIVYSPEGISFMIHDSKFMIHLKGQFDVYNSLAAISVAKVLGISLEDSQKALLNISVVPGRVEVLETSPFTVVVDYAYEPEEMRQLYETVARWPHKNILQVLGPCGGGRDTARIEILGEMAAKFAGNVIITTDDPYDDDPRVIGEKMKTAADKISKTTGSIITMELDRRMAIKKALNSAQAGDLVLITGKGADQKMALANGQYLEWDDRQVAKAELKN